MVSNMQVNLSGVNGEYKDLKKFATDSDSHLFGEGLEDFLKKVKGRHSSLKQSSGVSQARKRQGNADMLSSKSKNCRAKKHWTGQKGSPPTHKKHLASTQDSHVIKDHRGHRN